MATLTLMFNKTANDMLVGKNAVQAFLVSRYYGKDKVFQLGFRPGKWIAKKNGDKMLPFVKKGQSEAKMLKVNSGMFEQIATFNDNKVDLDLVPGVRYRLVPMGIGRFRLERTDIGRGVISDEALVTVCM